MVEKSKTLVVDKVIGHKLDLEETIITSEDSILYALGIGFSSDPLKKQDLQFTYEFSDSFKIFPTQMGTLSLNTFSKLFSTHPYIPNFNMMSLLHGEQWTEIIKPLTPGTKVKFNTELLDFEDKGSGTVFLFGSNFYLEDNSLAAKVNSIIFVRDIKGHKFKGNGILKKLMLPTKPPQSEPDIKAVFTTNKNQALIYRIGGKDPNPLHVDEDFAKMGGFDVPILHGMCFYGISCRAIFEKLTPEEVDNIISFNARFTSHVIPGETLEVSLWKGKDGKILVTVKTLERGKQVLIGEAQLKKTKF